MGSSGSAPHTKTIRIPGLMSFKVHKKMAAYNQWHLELTLDYINPIWRNDSALSHATSSGRLKIPDGLVEEGVLWQTGLLKVIEGVMSGRGKLRTLHPELIGCS